MKVVILGYGRMGKEVEAILLERGHVVAGIVDENNEAQLSSLTKESVDVVVEFTRPDVAFQNVAACIKQGIPVVSGTTGWHDKLTEAIELCNRFDGTFLYASNFSVGVNLLFALNTRLAQLMNTQPQYKPVITETHHVHKKDKPSGTAVSLAQQIISNIDRLNDFAESATSANEFSVKSIREGEVFGYHEVKYESEIDSIAVSHNALSRKGFALGAVIAAEFIHNKVGVYTMHDVLGF